jgi:hypothetical protein
MRALMPALCLVLLLAGIAPAADSLNVRLVGNWAAVMECSGIAADGDYVYLAAGWLHVVSVADPAHPVEVATVDSVSYFWDVAIDGDYAYLADDIGLYVVSVADPIHPVVVGHCDAPNIAYGVAAGGGYAYLADYTSGLRVISVADPAHPVEVGYYDTPGEACGVALAGTCVYVADNASGLRVISVADPAHPVEIGSTDSTIGAYKVVLSGNYANLVYGYGMGVISVADPAHPVEVGQCNLPGGGGPAGVAVNGVYAYVADQDGGLRVVSVADPAHPMEVGHYVEQNGLDEPLCVAAFGDYVYVGTLWDGLRAYQFYGAGVQETMNDGRGTMNAGPTVVRGVLSLPLASGVERLASCVLLDATGRKVLQLKPGANDVRALAPGVYFVKEAQAQAQEKSVRKVIITK